MVQAIEAARGTEIAAALQGRIRTGEELVIRKGDAGIEVYQAEETRVRESHPDLYGQLLKASEQIQNAGTSVMWVVGLAAVVFCAGIHREWFNHVGPMSVAKLQSVWTYIIVVVAGFILSMYWMEFLGARVYQNWKRTLVEGLAAAGLGHLQLLTQIEGHVELKSVAEKMKRDTEFERLD